MLERIGPTIRTLMGHANVGTMYETYFQAWHMFGKLPVPQLWNWRFRTCGTGETIGKLKFDTGKGRHAQSRR